MEKVEQMPITRRGRTPETFRMRLLGVIRLASEIIAPYFPMRTFVHHNPLHGLERLHFNEAVSLGEWFLGGKGYLSGEMYRDYVRLGRILPEHIDAVLVPYAKDKQVFVGNQPIRHIEVLRACMLNPINPFAGGAPPQDKSFIEALANHLSPLLKQQALQKETHSIANDEVGSLLRQRTLSAFLDSVLETDITKQINGEMIKWLSAFLDEGHAPWPMPCRENGFYLAWKSLVSLERSHLEILASREKLAGLSECPEETIIACLDAMGIPEENWQDYLTFHLCALHGWSGFIKWRADQEDYDWQESYPIHLSQYLAVRLWVERELVEKHCQAKLGVAGNCDAISNDIRLRPAAYSFHKERGTFAADVPPATECAPTDFAKGLVALAESLKIDKEALLETAPEDLAVLLNWMDNFGASEQGPIWLAALEASYRESLLSSLNTGEAKNLSPSQGTLPPQGASPSQGTLPLSPIRPQAQAVFCIDVRSEPLRRHLEAIGDYETFGFAGFFAAFIRHRALGDHHDTDQFPAIMKSKNEVREIPRSYQGDRLSRYRIGTRLLKMLQSLFHDLKENVITPYVMIEMIGWFYALPLIGKTVASVWYQTLTKKIQSLLAPKIATSLTINKLSKEEVHEMLAAEQRATIRTAFMQQFGDRGEKISIEQVEAFRLQALDETGAPLVGADEGAHTGAPLPIQPQPSDGLPPVGADLRVRPQASPLPNDEAADFIELLRNRYGINPHGTFARMERMTRTGFTLDEQVFTVETALRLMGLTQNFARLVCIVGHGSSVMNNPYESALDCGACGGNSGKPNARVLAAMANRREVRERLEKSGTSAAGGASAADGIKIPSDTYFIPAEHNTATDVILFFDLEDLPPTHRKDSDRMIQAFKEAGLQVCMERLAKFPQAKQPKSNAKAAREAARWSSHWSQVRPEWGVSGNAALIIGRRKMTEGISLSGRAFLHSYDYRHDPTGQLLEMILTGPQVVAQWINMEHYFSTVDNNVYGSGSKIYHNVVGRFGVMSGPASDLRIGLSAETVMNATRPYHEPMRLLVVIEAPRERIDVIIPRHLVLQNHYDNEWVQLVALDPEDNCFYRYLPKQGWAPSGGRVATATCGIVAPVGRD